LNQYREKNYPGKVFGHQTRFALGANWMGMGRVIPFVKLEYSMTNFPIWGQDNSKQYNFIEVKVGLRI
jgi:hypothetical protein